MSCGRTKLGKLPGVEGLDGIWMVMRRGVFYTGELSSWGRTEKACHGRLGDVCHCMKEVGQ